MCGGTGALGSAGWATPGLSPRVRGNRRRHKSAPCAIGSIPACAGEPHQTACPAPKPGVYPRVCGGTPGDPVRPVFLTGLSPRVRGNRQPVGGREIATGSIPACAGEPLAHLPQQQPRPVYPRVCGGTAAAGSISSPAVGLSPRVRGNPTGALGWGAGAGSIPACAGEPRRVAARLPKMRVYPRVCGGTGVPVGRPPQIDGLSPRVRGNLGCRIDPNIKPRSIPACAGEPSPQQARRPPEWVYPRVCGGTVASGGSIPRPQGLSPRVRGNPAGRHHHRAAQGSIPACAGEPATVDPPDTGRAVYPRVCGGTECWGLYAIV